MHIMQYAIKLGLTSKAFAAESSKTNQWEQNPLLCFYVMQEENDLCWKHTELTREVIGELNHI